MCVVEIESKEVILSIGFIGDISENLCQATCFLSNGKKMYPSSKKKLASKYDACNSGAENLQIGNSARLQICFYTLKVIHHQSAFLLPSFLTPPIALIRNFTL